jgi:histidine ammonia-lyase
MTVRVVLKSIAEMTLENAERLAFNQAELELSQEALERIDRGRERFEAYMHSKGDGYVYGSTTAPGARALVTLSKENSRRQGTTLRTFSAIKAGVAGDFLPERCVRLALFARLSNAMTGYGKLRRETAIAVASLLRSPPPVPMAAGACPGEVIPLSWLVAPLADFPLAAGEAMALVNGSPFATAMACDVGLTLRRRVKLAELIFALSIEAAECPLGHFDRRLADHWVDPYYKESLNRLDVLLQGSERKQLPHQAPTSWRVIPNILASCLQAIDDVSRSAVIGLHSLKDNPTFLIDQTGDEDDLIVSSAGYHDHRAAKCIDQTNSVLVDICVLAARQVARLLDGEGLGLPPLLERPGDHAGLEYLAWGLTEPLATARHAAESTTLDIGLHDPAGNQSDVASLCFVAYPKHRIVANAFDSCLATLAITAVLALEFRQTPIPTTLRPLWELLSGFTRSAVQRADVVGEPLRQAAEFMRACADEMSCAQFEAALTEGQLPSVQ